MDLPGLKRDDVSVVVTNDVLTVSGERREEHEETRDTWYSRERAFGAFSRSVTLPPGTDPAKVVAEFEDGVLEVRIPGAHPPREPRTVEVKQRIAKEKAPAERKAAKPPKAGATA
jgi:HSP20 family protein